MIVEPTSGAVSHVTGAIRDAARATGASFDYLLKTAVRESNLDPAAKAATSSATGLFQFVDQTWLETLKSAGPQLGYAEFASDIVQSPSGQLSVPDAARRREILALRNDPAAAAAMAGAFTQRNAALLGDKLGRPPTGGELYIAHFMGGTGAVQLISAAANTPAARASDVFPEAAQANRSIFFERGGSARSVAQVYELLVAKHDRTPSAVPAPVTNAVAALSPAAPGSPGSDDFATRSPLHLPPLPGEAGAPQEGLPGRAARRGESGPVFHSLFRSEGRGAVSSFVSEMWGTPNAASAPRATQTSANAPAGSSPRTLELFRTAP